MCKTIIYTALLVLCLLLANTSQALAESWPMKQKDQYRTGRAEITIPENRTNDSFFDVFLWQTPTPGSPIDGKTGGSSMSFFDGAGPEGKDIVVGGYHWPKGLMALDRHTGEKFWEGNPGGGEQIGEVSPAFSKYGSTLYINNDYAESGATLFAFNTSDGPDYFWDNAFDFYPEHFLNGSPIVCYDANIIFASAWDDRPYGALDGGSFIYEFWQAAYSLGTTYSEPAIYSIDQDNHLVVATGRYGQILVTDSNGFELWSAELPDGTDATPSFDPNNGNLYLACGWSDIYIVGYDIDGNLLWEEQVFDIEDGTYANQHAIGSGCLSHDGTVYYFQTVAEDGSGKLYAINTNDGSTRWIYETQSKGWERTYSCPVVTQNSIVIVGNNDNGRYFAIKDNGQDDAILLDTFDVSHNGEGTPARASATVSSDGKLYLPLCTTWTTGNGDDDTPDFSIQNLFCAFDLTAEASVTIYPPSQQRAFAGNSQIEIKWQPITDTATNFSHYAVYRSENFFDSVEGKTPVGTISDINQSQWLDNTVTNDTPYFYAVTSVTGDMAEVKIIDAIGPRVPTDQTDIQVVSISRTPYYPRYNASYTNTLVTEANGFGPYWFSACTALDGGQDENTKHLPEIGETTTYTATIRNRGTNPISQTATISWTLDGLIVDSESVTIALEPGEIWQKTLNQIWDNNSHELSFNIDITDSRPENNTLTIDTKSVGFLTYIDRSFIEKFRDEWSKKHPGSTTDDPIDWLNMHMTRFNELFADAGCDKRVRYDILQVIDDYESDPTTPEAINFAIFPFRYHWYTDGDPRTSGYYHNDDDIDYGLLHEMGHQMGMIDVYQLNLDGASNQVNGQSYSAHADLMTGCSPFINEFHALAMQSWLNTAHGMYGQFLYNIPATVQLQLIGRDGNPLGNADVKIYQMAERDGLGKVITNQVKAQGTCDSQGIFTLPNVPVDNGLVPQSPSGEILNDNPFGYVHVIGNNGLLLFEVEYNGERDFCWLDITETNVAYWKGDTDNAIFERQLAIGGPRIEIMPRDLAENNHDDWLGWAQAASGTISLDSSNFRAGNSSIKFDTDGAFDTYIRYPASYNAQWDLSNSSQLHIWFYAENDSQYGFQENSPWIRLKDSMGNYFQYRWYQNGNEADFLNQCNYQWREAVIDLYGDFVDNGWNRSEYGTTDMTNINSIEIHADTWGDSFRLWVDGLYFDWPPYKYCDFETDGIIDMADLAIFAEKWLSEGLPYSQTLGTDLNADGIINMEDLAILAQSWLSNEI